MFCKEYTEFCITKSGMSNKYQTFSLWALSEDRAPGSYSGFKKNDPIPSTAKYFGSNRTVPSISYKRPSLGERDLSTNWETVLISNCRPSSSPSLKIPSKTTNLRIFNTIVTNLPVLATPLLMNFLQVAHLLLTKSSFRDRVRESIFPLQYQEFGLWFIWCQDFRDFVIWEIVSLEKRPNFPVHEYTKCMNISNSILEKTLPEPQVKVNLKWRWCYW